MDIEVTNIDGSTCLFYAAGNNQWDFIGRYVKEMKANLNQKDKFGLNMPMRAAEQGRFN